MHGYIFQDLFEWTGMPRTIPIYKKEDVLGGQSIEYSNPATIENDIHYALLNMREKDWPGMTHKEKALEFCDSLARL